MNRFLLALSFFVPFVMSAQAQEQQYVGADKCKICHQKAYDIWNRSSHSRAHETLPQEKRQELRCLFCHATDVREDLKGYRLLAVQCEACHGPGAQHVTLATSNDPEEKQKPKSLEKMTESKCRECHTDVRSPTLRAFSYETALQAIKHW
ncbi:MAG TPA: multiheme c-type cytochrome [Bdellovibrionota bacterium]|nr:multiheme c-type cytochrome [Bdellovibrionota bacterium]